MLFRELFSYPDRDVGVEPGRVGYGLSEMIVICLLQLVLYDDLDVRRNVPSYYVGLIRSDRHFRTFQFELRP